MGRRWMVAWACVAWACVGWLAGCGDDGGGGGGTSGPACFTLSEADCERRADCAAQKANPLDEANQCWSAEVTIGCTSTHDDTGHTLLTARDGAGDCWRMLTLEVPEGFTASDDAGCSQDMAVTLEVCP
jgi:hypothetical protein